MTYRDPSDPETRVVERERYVERPVETAPAASSAVNVNSPGSATYVEPAAGPLYWARRVVSLLFGILAVLLALRIILLLLAANQANDIVNFVYNITEPFVAPFRGIFQFDVVSPGGGNALDVSAVVALIGWLLIYLLIMAILRLGDRTPETV
jgi:uncharacterized protein YggT (Ycf19 family)